MSEILADVGTFVDSAILLAKSPADQECGYLYGKWLDKVLGEVVLLPVSLYDPDAGFAGGSEYERLAAEYLNQPKFGALEKEFLAAANDLVNGPTTAYKAGDGFSPLIVRRMITLDLTNIGHKAPLSGKITEEISDLYQILISGWQNICSRLDEKNTLKYMIGNRLVKEYVKVASGLNFNPVESDVALHNIKEALHSLRYNRTLRGWYEIKQLKRIIPIPNIWTQENLKP